MCSYRGESTCPPINIYLTLESVGTAGGTWWSEQARWPARHHTNGRFRVWQPGHLRSNLRRLTEVARGSWGL